MSDIKKEEHSIAVSSIRTIEGEKQGVTSFSVSDEENFPFIANKIILFIFSSYW